MVDSEIIRFVSDIKESASHLDKVKARTAFDSLLKMADVQNMLSNAEEVLKNQKSTPTYLVSSWFLHKCYRYLMSYDVEALHFVTGMEIEGGFTLDKMIKVGMSRQTPVSAVGDITSTHQALLKIESYGHRLVACFHSHPSCGPGATIPSSTDIDYQARQENGGYVAIGGIFSRDGYFRVFSLDIPFKLEVYGKGVQRINDKLFHLYEIN